MRAAVETSALVRCRGEEGSEHVEDRVQPVGKGVERKDVDRFLESPLYEERFRR